MTPRLNYFDASPAAMDAMRALDHASRQLSIAPELRELIKMRVSQLNGCAYCLDMHAPEARRVGISQQKLDVLAAWSESPVFSPRERAALGWADAMTRLAGAEIPETCYAALSAEFDARECTDLTLVIVAINAWNRFAVGFHSVHPLRADAA